MLSAFLSLALVLPMADGDIAFTPGMQFSFQGSVAEVSRERPAPNAPSKRFDLTFVVSEADDSGMHLYWLVDERGQGQWPWLDRFGRLSLDANYKAIGPQGPALLYDYGSGKHVIPLTAPLLATTQPLAAGAEWEQEGLDYEVEGAKEIDDRETWQIAVKNNFGPKRTLWVEKKSPLVVSLNERVFMDKGNEYQLQMKFAGVESLSDEQFKSTKRGFDALLALRQKLKRAPRTQSEELAPDQRTLLADQLPELEATITTGSLAKLVRGAARELELQAGRADAVAKLSSKYVGQPVEKFSIPGLAQGKLTESDLQDKITVLHFWDYRDEPLKEPYGQVGYLEFLHNRRKGDGVNVYGIAVDGRLHNENTRKTATVSIRKLKTFMNLTYPLMLDDGELLKQFGDPRLLGETLPLFVVVGPDGTIVHYHVGFYKVDRQDGLKELDAIVSELLKKNT
jgi:peroxiredoxin